MVLATNKERGMKKLMLLAAVCVAMTGCLDKSDDAKSSSPVEEKIAAEKPTEAAPVVDISSPDKALKSYWAVIDWKRRFDAAHYKASLESDWGRARNGAVAKVAIPAFADNYTAPQSTYEREIVEAKVETDTRATIHVVIRNSTPIPEGADVTDYDRKRRAQGDKYRYVLERGDEGWKVAEIWEFDSILDKKWTKTAPHTPKPSAGTLTISGH